LIKKREEEEKVDEIKKIADEIKQDVVNAANSPTKRKVRRISRRRRKKLVDTNYKNVEGIKEEENEDEEMKK